MRIKKQIIRRTVFIFLLSAGVIGALIIPSIYKINSLSEELSVQQKEIEKRYELRNYVKQTLFDIDTAQEQMEIIRQTFVMEDNELEFIKAIEDAISVAGVEEREKNLINANETELTLWEKEVPIKIRIGGHFPNVMSWLNEIEHLNYYIIFDSITISVARNGGVPDNEGRVEALFNGRVQSLASDAPYFLDFNYLPGNIISPTESDNMTEE